jgi:hypothetical protein
MILFNAFATFTSAQAVNFTDTLGTPGIAQPKPKKDKKREIYINFYVPGLSAPDQQLWSTPYIVRPQIDTIYYSYQDNEKHHYYFNGFRGITIGFDKKRFNLGKDFFVKVGFAFDIFGFEFKHTTEKLETLLISEFHKNNPSILQEVTIKEINKEKGNNLFPIVTYDDTILHFLTSVLFPISLEYKLGNNINIGANLKFRLPISANVYGYYYDYRGNKFNASNEATSIARLSSTLGLYLKYNLSSKFFVAVNGDIGPGLLNREAQTTAVYRGIKASKFYSYGLKFGYYY